MSCVRVEECARFAKRRRSACCRRQVNHRSRSTSCVRHTRVSRCCVHLTLLATTNDKMDEIVDPMPQIRADCLKTCPKPLADYEACKDRIKDKPGVSCEIWYYGLHHCVDKCVAPKIFAATKE